MSSTKDSIPSDDQLRETVDNLLTKIYRKVEIEGNKMLLTKLKHQQKQEEKIYDDESSGKLNIYQIMNMHI